MQCKCSKTSYVLAARCATLVALVTALPVHAQQFVLVDQTYTANAGNTTDSHFTAELQTGIPTNLRAPTNYANGSVHVDLEIIEAPSATDGLYNICLENSSDVACLPYVMYKGKGKYTANPNFSLFWQNDKVDWTKGVSKVDLIIKDAKEQKAQGSSTYYPYKAHVTLTVVAEGSTFDPDATDSGASGSSGMQGQGGKGGGGAMSQGGKGGGSAGGMSSTSSNGGAGGMSASMPKGGSGGSSTASGGASAPAAGGGAGSAASSTSGATKPAQTPPVSTTAGSSSTPTSRATVNGGVAGSSDEPQTISSQLEDTSGCSITQIRSRASSLWPLLAAGLLANRARKRRRHAART